MSTLLEYLHQTVLSSNRIVRVYDRHADELKRLLAARMMEFNPDARVSGRATAPIEVGSLRGTRYRFGSERVPSGDRVVQVDLYKRDDGSEEPRSVTLALGTGAEDPIVLMPTTVQLVFGFGNICGDLGVLERRLAYRVVAYNRSPNERALNALENGVPSTSSTRPSTSRVKPSSKTGSGEPTSGPGSSSAGSCGISWTRDSSSARRMGASRSGRA